MRIDIIETESPVGTAIGRWFVGHHQDKANGCLMPREYNKAVNPRERIDKPFPYEVVMVSFSMSTSRKKQVSVIRHHGNGSAS